MTRAMMAASIMLFVVVLSGSGFSRDIRVPGEAASLQHALELAAPGDRILLAAGRYHESGLSLRDQVSIVGDPDDPGSVIIDGGGQAAVLRAESLLYVLLQGVTITGGLAIGQNTYESSGGALLASNTNIYLEHVHFRGNRAGASGGAVRVGRGNLTASDCLFEDNHALKGGGAIDLSYDATASLERVRLRNNSAAWGGAISVRASSSCWLQDSELIGNTAITPQEMGGAFFSDHAAKVALTSCIIAGNSARQGGGARLNGVTTLFANCTIDGNQASEAGGAIMIAGTEIALYRSIISFNDGPALSGEAISLFCEANNIYGNLGGDWNGALEPSRQQLDNLSEDPLFCASDDYHLQAGSPCAPDNNAAGLIGALPVGCTDVNVSVLFFTARRQGGRVLLEWRVDPGQHAFRLQGRAAADSTSATWNVPYTAAETPGDYEASDAHPFDCGALIYRLDIGLADGSWLALGEARVAAAECAPRPLLSLDSIYPNPFNPLVNIVYTLDQSAPVRAAIFDLNGRLVADLAADEQPAGTHRLTWNGLDLTGRPLAAGTYLLRIASNGSGHAAKLMLLK